MENKAWLDDFKDTMKNGTIFKELKLTNENYACSSCRNSVFNNTKYPIHHLLEKRPFSEFGNGTVNYCIDCKYLFCDSCGITSSHFIAHLFIVFSQFFPLNQLESFASSLNVSSNI